MIEMVDEGHYLGVVDHDDKMQRPTIALYHDLSRMDVLRDADVSESLGSMESGRRQ